MSFLCARVCTSKILCLSITKKLPVLQPRQSICSLLAKRPSLVATNKFQQFGKLQPIAKTTAFHPAVYTGIAVPALLCTSQALIPSNTKSRFTATTTNPTFICKTLPFEFGAVVLQYLLGKDDDDGA